MITHEEWKRVEEIKEQYVNTKLGQWYPVVLFLLSMVDKLDKGYYPITTDEECRHFNREIKDGSTK